MAKLQINRKVVIQPDVPNLLHDIILSLCQRKYCNVTDVEVDGIICISFGGLSEQQVIKIHENLQSNQKAKATDSVAVSRSATAENSAKLNELDLHLEVENITETEKDTAGHDDNDETSNHFTEDENVRGNEDSSTNYRSDISFLSSLLKTTNNLIVNDPDDATKKVKKVRGVKPGTENKVSRRKRKNPIHHPVGSPKKAYTDESLTDSRTESNDFSNEIINPAMVVVKQEPLDEETNPKAVDIFSANTASAPVGEHIDSLPSSYQIGLETDNGRYNEFDGRLNPESLHRSQSHSRSTSSDRQPSSGLSKDIAENEGENNTNIVIKQERMDDAEYGAAYGDSDDTRRKVACDDVASGFNNGAYPDYLQVADYFAHDTSSPDPNGSSATVRKKTGKSKKDNSASKTWFETVKKNMNKYQTALLKSVQITKKGAEDNRPSVHGEFLEPRDLNDKNVANSQVTPVLKSILESRSKDIPERNNSSSPTATVKKEIAEDDPDEQNSENTQPKLGSKYPALFTQLQKIKETENQNDMTSQPDSLVNRLPFLSFKDLFAQASPNTPSSSIDMRPSPERLADLLTQPSKLRMPLLEQDQEISHHVMQHSTTTPKRTWNWKKRAVRPKGPNGEILTNLPPQLPRTGERPVGIANPKRQKPKSKNEDRDWLPHHASDEVTAEVRAAGISTRLSSRRARRTNFTEFSDSDIEEIELEEDIYVEPDNEDQIELVSAYCRYNCGVRLESLSELRAHEETCSGKNFKCEYCGLDFNQQYRWQYHMIKVHGVSVNSAMFR